MYELLSEIPASHEIQMNCVMIPHFLDETYQFKALPPGQMLNSGSRKLLNQVTGFLQSFSTHP